MNNTSILSTITGAGAGMFVSLLCVIIMTLYCFKEYSGMRKNLSKILIYYYLFMVFNWMSMIFYIGDTDLFISIQSFTFISYLIPSVLIYIAVSSFTKVGTEKHLLMIHSILPLSICLIVFIWSFFVPFEVKKFIVDSRGDFPEGYESYAALFTLKMPLMLIYTITYPLLCLSKINAYHKAVVDYSADVDRSSVSWLYMLSFIMLANVPFPFVAVLFGKGTLVNSILTLIPIAMIMVQCIILCYNMVVGNYVFIPSQQNTKELEKKEINRNVSKKDFENYIKTKKPYLNPQLKISDIAEELKTNRTYLSTFINKEYEMNFSRYINRHRLFELEKLRVDPDLLEIEGMELVQKAGFNSYRAYIRVKNEETKKTILQR